ncbi:hypothetical protein KKC94_00050 [Patescibacteria group bacterium]|nr:hypothetical protein [Patescibacteria group bacterium]
MEIRKALPILAALGTGACDGALQTPIQCLQSVRGENSALIVELLGDEMVDSDGTHCRQFNLSVEEGREVDPRSDMICVGENQIRDEVYLYYQENVPGIDNPMICNQDAPVGIPSCTLNCEEGALVKDGDWYYRPFRYLVNWSI